jgi:hypothetical protein
MHAITVTDEHARDFLFQRGILKSSMSCPKKVNNVLVIDKLYVKTPVREGVYEHVGLLGWCPGTARYIKYPNTYRLVTTSTAVYF